MDIVQVDKILAKLVGPVQIENAQSAVVQPVPPVEELVALKKQVYIYSNSFAKNLLAFKHEGIQHTLKHSSTLIGPFVLQF